MSFRQLLFLIFIKTEKDQHWHMQTHSHTHFAFYASLSIYTYTHKYMYIHKVVQFPTLLVDLVKYLIEDKIFFALSFPSPNFLSSL